jgi:hypothetical protein
MIAARRVKVPRPDLEATQKTPSLVCPGWALTRSPSVHSLYPLYTSVHGREESCPTACSDPSDLPPILRMLRASSRASAAAAPPAGNCTGYRAPGTAVSVLGAQPRRVPPRSSTLTDPGGIPALSGRGSVRTWHVRRPIAPSQCPYVRTSYHRTVHRWPDRMGTISGRAGVGIRADSAPRPTSDERAVNSGTHRPDWGHGPLAPLPTETGASAHYSAERYSPTWRGRWAASREWM